jgi:hypothetical protein
VAVANMGNIVDAIQDLVAVFFIEILSLSIE